MICQRCNLDKGDDFRRSKKICRECQNEMIKEYRHTKLKEKVKPEFIICRKCNKQTSDFPLNSRICNDCHRARGREYRRNTNKAKIWTNNNKERHAQLIHDWYEKNKIKNRKKRAERMKNEPNYRLGMNHRIACSNIISGRTKSSKYINCKGELFVDWIKFQFSEEMTLANHNEIWTLDHLIPVHKFLSNEYSADIVLNWANVRPVLKKENLVKNKYLTEDECIIHYEILRTYLENHKLDKKPYLEYFSALEKICEEKSVEVDESLDEDVTENPESKEDGYDDERAIELSKYLTERLNNSDIPFEE